MEETIIRVGLPVKCRLCEARGRVKPGTDYGGWAKRKTSQRLSWYCPDHADSVPRLAAPVLGSLAKEPEPKDTLDELMNLI